MTTPGKLKITIKINEFADDVQVNENNWKSFVIDCDGTQVSITVKPKVFKKVEQAKENYPMWVGACSFTVPGGNVDPWGKPPRRDLSSINPTSRYLSASQKSRNPVLKSLHESNIGD
ncbi:fertility inhibition FinO-like protein [Synechocystis salina]|uniref:fertility inhibition FinO-like protein n=1 Tax=Synechocystis salina TaxID=945780 RepID=UPI001D14F1B1|nr:fertility inhibition FinO-like protein [Synechocystis salina]